MPEYIARDAARKAFASQNESLQAACYSVIDSIPAADVAEVVRCKDCCYWNRKYTTVGECEKLADRDQEGGAQFDCDTEDDDFCSYGRIVTGKQIGRAHV